MISVFIGIASNQFLDFEFISFGVQRIQVYLRFTNGLDAVFSFVIANFFLG